MSRSIARGLTPWWWLCVENGSPHPVLRLLGAASKGRAAIVARHIVVQPIGTQQARQACVRAACP